MKRPPGYADPEAPSVDGVTGGLTAYLLLLFAALAGAAHELILVQPSAWLLSAATPSPATSQISAALGALLGAALATRLRTSARAVCPAGAALALWVAASGPIWARSFESGRGELAVTWLWPGVGAALVAVVAVSAARYFGPLTRRLPVLDLMVRPFSALSAVAFVGVASAVATGAGVLRSAAAISMVLSVGVVAFPALFVRLEARPLADHRLARAAGLLSFAVGLVVFGASVRWVPIQTVGDYAGTVLHYEQTARRSYVVTSGQDSYELWIDGKLRISTLDEARYFEALVHPALSSAKQKARVLLLGGGTGMAEREILRHDAVRSVTVVNPDPRLVELCRSMRWTSQRAGQALDAPGVHFIEAEPIVWLSEADDRFDVAIVDLPDPVTHLDAKNYTVHFYELLARRLMPDAVVAIQATSPFASPKAAASIAASARAAGFVVRPYRAPVPTFGEWGFLLASTRAAPTPDVQALGRLLSGMSAAELLVPPADAQLVSESPNFLYDQHVVHLLEVETRASGL